MLRGGTEGKMPITIRQLEIFNAVVESGQVTKAAKSLFISQSAVSLALNEMENQLGGPLFDRTARCLELNDRGRYLLPLGREILDKLENLDHLMNEKDGRFAGTLHLVASSTVGNYVLPYLISAFQSMHPDVYFNMLVSNTTSSEQLVMDRAVDLAFVEGEVHNQQIITTEWFHDELVLVSRPLTDSDSEMTCDIATDIKKYDWIMREAGSGTAHTFKMKLGKYITDLHVIMELGHTEAIKKAVEAGAGVACLSNLTVCKEIDSNRLQQIKIEGVDMKRQLFILQHKNRTQTRLVSEFFDFCLLLSQCKEGRACLTSPENLEKLVEQFIHRS
jgi:DNA-binding transcriptional LysR family regulator